MRPIYNNREKLVTLNSNKNVIIQNNKTNLKSSDDKTQSKSKSQILNNKNVWSKYSRNDVNNNKSQADNLLSFNNNFFVDKNNLKPDYLYNYLEIFTIGLLVYLLYRNVFDLCIKHIFYFLATDYFNLEYIFLSIVSLFQIGLLLASLFYVYKYNDEKTEVFACVTLASQLVAFSLFGFTQFFHNMTIWDHKFRLNILFDCELLKFIVELVFVCLLLTYKLFKCFNLIKFKIQL